MSVIKVPNSKFYYALFQLDGKRYLFSTKTTNKVLARQIEAKERERIVSEKSLGRPLEQITVGDAFEMFVKSKEGTPYHKVLVAIRNPLLHGSKKCIRTKKRVEVYSLDREMMLQHLRSSDMNRLVDARRKEGNAEATIRQHVMAMAGAWRYCKSLGYMVDDSMEFPSFKKEKKPIVYLTSEEEDRLIKSLDPNRHVPGYGKPGERNTRRHQRLVDAQDFVTVLLDTGVRHSELSTLTWDKVDLESRHIVIYQIKTGKTLTLVMTDRAYEVLSRRASTKTHHLYVFPNDKRNGPRKYHNTFFNRAVQRAGIEKRITHHSTRRTFASKLAIAGVSIQKISSLLGHSSVTQTMVYAALQPNDAAMEAVEVLNGISKSQKL